MLSSMRSQGWPCVFGLVGLSGLVWTPALATTTQFYSWVTPAGEMVLTDDSGRIPPASARGPVSVHRYQEIAPSISIQSRQPSSPDVSTQEEAVGITAALQDAEVRDPNHVFPEEPEESLAANDDWNPNASPVTLSAAPVYGFWSSRGQANRSTVLARSVRQLQRLASAWPQARRPYQAAMRENAGMASRAARDRQALFAGAALGRPFGNVRTIVPASGHPSRCCLTNHLHADDRPGASKR